MAGRRTNLALLILLVVAFATGVIAFGIGAGWNRWVAVMHGAVGLAIVLLAPWKSIIARRGIRRRRSGTTASIVFSLFVAVALIFGILHSTGIATSLGGLSAMQIHVGAALLTIPLALWHVVARRVRIHHTDLSRRQALKALALGAGAGALYAGVEAAVKLSSLPGARRRFTGSHERGSFDPGAMPVTQWLDDSVPVVDIERWRLTVDDGRRRTSRGYDDLRAASDRVRATIDCTGGWFATQDWEGIRVDRLFSAPIEARSIEFRSVTGYERRLPASSAGDLLLALRVGGEPLDPGHGYPARLVVPGRRGFWWVKWVESVALSDVPWWVQPPFPLT